METAGGFEPFAEWNSAIQQIENLRYSPMAKKPLSLEEKRPPLPDRSNVCFAPRLLPRLQRRRGSFSRCGVFYKYVAPPELFIEGSTV
jgi:hypothetical protein